jgi:hypothetical protein
VFTAKYIRLLAPALFALTVAIGAPALWAQDVNTNYMPGTDFAKYKTYHWKSIEAGRHPNQIVDAEIKSAVDKQLKAKGLTEVQDEKADMTVAYQTAVGKEREWNTVGMGGGWRWGGGMATSTSETISVGTIVLDFYDSGSKSLVWQGRATKTIDEHANQEKTQKNLDKAMQKLLKNYPPKQK